MEPWISDFIRANLPLAPVPFVPEIRIHKAVPTSGLWRLAERDERFGSPYWAHFWGGGLVLARYILDHPEVVAGRRVLDLGTGSGLVAIAAARAGAREVTAADIDPYAIAAARLNAHANGAVVAMHLGDLTGGDPTQGETPCSWDVIAAGDLFYERETAARVAGFLRRQAEQGCHILIGDPWRAHLPHESLDPIATFRVREFSGAESPTGLRSSVFALKP